MVRDRAREIRESLGKIRTYTAQPDTDFFADERNSYTVMHLLLISIEAVASICNHLLAKTASKAPASYSECFEGLRELGILDEPVTDRLIQMVRFRNILLHRSKGGTSMNESMVLDWLLQDAEKNGDRHYRQGIKLEEALRELNNRQENPLPASLPKSPEKMVPVLREHFKDKVTFISLVLSHHFPEKYLFSRVFKVGGGNLRRAAILLGNCS
jgi:uncharacterized protein YutE (UPF0331/DUF86 family)